MVDCPAGQILNKENGYCYNALTASCSVAPISASLGKSVLWTATASGDDGYSYRYSWTGTDIASATAPSGDNTLPLVYVTS